jgi:hypothetical protein
VVPLHAPLQHVALPASFEQAWPSDVHCAAAQKPFAPQLSEQQSVGAEQGVPCAKHWVTLEAQVLVWVSQTPEQHVAPLTHEELKTPHEIDPSGAVPSPVTDASTEPPVPTEPSVPPAPPDVPPPAPPTDTSVFEPSTEAS